MADRKPNILFILNDHQAYYRHGWDGGLKPARPHFDRLASEGVNFNRSYTVCPLCTRARCTVLTGLLPHNHGFVTLDAKGNAQEKDQGILYSLLEEPGCQLFSYGNRYDRYCYAQCRAGIDRKAIPVQFRAGSGGGDTSHG